MGFFTKEPESAKVAGFDLEWTGPNADCTACARCGYIHWFLPTASK